MDSQNDIEDVKDSKIYVEDFMLGDEDEEEQNELE